MLLKKMAQISLLFTSVVGYGQTPKPPIIKDASVQFLSTQICDCLAMKQMAKQGTSDAFAECIQEELAEHGAQILEENKLADSKEVGQEIGLILVKELGKTCPAFTKIRAESPDQKQLDRAIGLYEAGKYEEALLIYDKLIRAKLILIDWTIFNQRGLDKLELGDYYGALADFEYAIQRDSTAAVAYNNRGMAKAKLGLKQSAYSDYTLALSLDSTQAPMYENRGVLLYDDEQYDRATADLLRAVALKSTSADVYYYLGMCGKEQKNYSDTTASYFTKALALDPTNHVFQNARGLFYDDKKDAKRARADYVATMKLNPAYNPAYFNLAQIELTEKKPAEALRHLNTAIRLDSTYEIYYNKKAEALLDLKRYKEALVAIDQGIALNPDRADLYDTRGSIHDAMNNPTGAVEAYTKSIGLADRDGLIYYRRGLARLKLADSSGACDDFRMGQLFKNDEAIKAVQQHCRK